MNCNHNSPGSSRSNSGDGGDEKNISEQIIQKVSEREQVDPADLDPPLYTAIDADSLESLFDRTDGDLEVTFRWNDYTIVVNQDAVFICDEE